MYGYILILKTKKQCIFTLIDLWKDLISLSCGNTWVYLKE